MREELRQARFGGVLLGASSHHAVAQHHQFEHGKRRRHLRERQLRADHIEIGGCGLGVLCEHGFVCEMHYCTGKDMALLGCPDGNMDGMRVESLYIALGELDAKDFQR
ncbi:hypothetical protein BW12_02925 [Bifidobacterium sp. UTCIF-3]|nr:hypothetical protein BW12_02925 [Bifidobacterium sp. UTCIF-3]TPF84539.1 hypothetical protein BW07_04635 [Bifidobacterium sp. UTCIF-36]TPF90900.1 hypothetical protein BW10_01400 [Bifidobacterium sp. UTBIF-56]